MRRRLDRERPAGGRRPIEDGLSAIGSTLDAIERSARFQASGRCRHPDEAPPRRLPPLHLVTGWSRADPAKPRHNPKLALFGGWRIEEMERKRRGGVRSGRAGLGAAAGPL